MKRETALPLLLTGFLLTCSAPALAIYRCDAGGSVVYSDKECPGAKTLDIDAAAPAGTSDAARLARDEKQQLERLERARHRREAKEERELQRSAKAATTQQKKCASLARKRKWAEEDATAATGKSIETTHRKARRAAEEHEAECGRHNTLGMAR